MTILTDILIVILWIILGNFISYKRKWYSTYEVPEMFIIINMMFSPIALLIALFNEFIWKDWSNS